MAVKVLKKTVNIELCHRLFRERLGYEDYEQYHILLKFQQNRPEERHYADVVWVEDYGFWMDMPDPWHLNAFGLCQETPSAWEVHAVTCTLDFNPGRTGAFGRDEYAGILVLHNGAFDINKADNSKQFFWEHYQGPRIQGSEQGELYAVVAHLGALDVAKQLKEYLEALASVQALA